LPTPESGAGSGAGERIGLLGGTFDPPHLGHLAIAQAALGVLELDRLLMVVANHPWQKVDTRRILPAEDRFAMVEAAVAGLPGIEASRIEIDRGGPSYTVETVEQLRADALAGERPLPEVVLVVGADLATELDTWERSAELCTLVQVAVVSRPGCEGATPPPGWDWVAIEGLRIDISSSEVRARLAAGASAEDLVPAPVIHCIEARNLYAVPR
jgi:nicotinate-nucleotide adenylyltransferase